jgi:Mrp family chromosome partitioning ATPase
MESFVNALARAQDPAWLQSHANRTSVDIAPLRISEQVVELSPRALKANRVVSFDGADKITRSFDVLRNTCVKDLAPRVADCPIFGVTSPLEGCGASTTAINLAFSIARQHAAVMIADLNTSGQMWWKQLVVERAGLHASPLRDTVVKLEVADMVIHATSLHPVLDGKTGSDLKDGLRNWVASVRRDLGPVCIVVDLPPLLSADRTAALMSEFDQVILVLATGKSTMAELNTSKSYLQDAPRVQLVLNKARRYDL